MDPRSMTQRKAAAMQALQTWLAANGSHTLPPANHAELRELALLETLAHTLARIPAQPSKPAYRLVGAASLAASTPAKPRASPAAAPGKGQP